jgi:6-phosphogluconolactonase (cycloisomerase 2 family)
MGHQYLSRYSAAVAVFGVAVFLASCGSSSSPSSGQGPVGVTSSVGGFAAGIGGSGQTGSAHFLVAIQVPGLTPIATSINSSGTLTAATVTVNPYSVFNPMAITGAIDPSGTFFYEAVHPGLWAFTINRQNGNVTEISTSPYDDSVNFDAVVVDQLGKFVYAYDGAGEVYAYSIQAGTGQLSPVTGSPFATASSGEQDAIASNRIAVSQNDDYLYLASSAGIEAYSINATTGALTSVSGSPFGASAGAGFALVAPSSGFLYETIQTNTPTSPGIYGYSIDPNTGALASISGSPFGSSCGAADPTSPANGNFLFAASCGMYQISASSGALTFLFNDPQAPYDGWAAFDPASAFLWIVTSQEPCFDCNIGVDAYQVDSTTGNMTLVPNSFYLMQNSQVGSIQALAITH